MKIGILGGGNVGGALGEVWARAGHEILYGVRDPHAADLAALIARSGGRARAGTAADAAAFGEVVLVALPWPATRAVLQSLELRGKIVLDATNPFKADLSGLEVGTTLSGGELVAGWAMGARVVKVFNTTGSNNMLDSRYGEKPVPMFYCGDDAQACAVAADLASAAGFAPLSAGPLNNARLLEPYAALWVWLAFHGMGREFAFQIETR